MVVRDLLEFDIILLGFDFLTRFSWRGKKNLYWYGRKCFSLLK